MIVATWYSFGLYFPNSLKVYSPFNDTHALMDITMGHCVLAMMMANVFLFFLFVTNCCWLGSNGWAHQQLQKALKYGYAHTIIRGNMYASF